MTPIPLRDLIKRALLLDAREVRLIPGRRTVVVVPAGESEVRGEPQTPESINTLLEEVLTPEARRGLASGWTEWEFALEGRGTVRACAELKVGLVHATFYLEHCSPGAGPKLKAAPAVAEKKTAPKAKAQPGTAPDRLGAALPPPRLRLGQKDAAPAARRGMDSEPPSFQTDEVESLSSLAADFDSGFEADFGKLDIGLDDAMPPPGNGDATRMPSYSSVGLDSELPPALGGRPSGAKHAIPIAAMTPAVFDKRGLAGSAKKIPAEPAPPTQRRPTPLPTVPPAAPEVQAIVGAGLGSSTESIDQLLRNMIAKKASDLHISTGAVPMMRVDGEMKAVSGQKLLAAEDVHRIVWPIVPARNREEFSASKDTDFAYEIEGVARFRGNIFVDLRGMGAVFRVIPSRVLTVEDLKLPASLLPLTQLSKGLVLVTGPTGSGKSTTLAALVDYANKTRHDHIITIEDPVEFVHKNIKCLINQRQVGEHTKSFKTALRAALREDPDIVLLGEMRDLETISIALETAETGHLVFGTLHTSSAPATVDRIVDQFPAEEQNQIRVMLANSLKGVVSQMLCKKIGGGRVAALEIMLGVPAIANLIREQKIFQIQSVIQTSRKMGMCLMNESLLDLIKSGQVSPEEAWLKSNDKAVLKTMLQNNDIPLPPSADLK